MSRRASALDMHACAARLPQVLYSDFVALLDTNRVRAARLESGTGKLYFDIRHTPQPQQQAMAAAAPAAAAAAELPAAAALAAAASKPAAPALAAASMASSAAATASTSGAPAALAEASAAAPQLPAAAVAASSAARQRFVKQFYIKLADKYDPMLVMRIMQVCVPVGSRPTNIPMRTAFGNAARWFACSVQFFM